MIRPAGAILAISVFAITLAGCASPVPPPPPAAGNGAPAPPTETMPTFSQGGLIDEIRPGGEPVIVITKNGVILISAHPGLSHLHPQGDPTQFGSAAPAASAQSYLWRSLDAGSTWESVALPIVNEGPRSAGVGVGDPELAVGPTNVVYFSDLEALTDASVSWSMDDGATWTGNPAASGAPMDRQWLAAHADAVYFTGNFFTDRRVLRSTDNGLTWERIGEIPVRCPGDIVAAPDGTLYAGCAAGVAASEDGGVTWEHRPATSFSPAQGDTRLTEPAVDGGGNVWTTWQEGEREVYLAGSPDRGLTWPWILDLTPSFAQALTTQDVTLIWPWVSAGSEGRIAVTVYGSPAPPPSDSASGNHEWSVVTASVFGANRETPTVFGQVVKRGIHVGAICQIGTRCQATSLQGDPEGDRRLGDFFETTIDTFGYLHIAYADTTAHPEDLVSHPGYVRQTGGSVFVVDGYEPTQG